METTPAFFCDQCGKCFSDKSSFNSHQRYHDTDRKQCGKCGIYFPNLVLLQQHLNKHDSSKEHVCNVCEKIFSSRSSLSHHKKRHLLIFECNICNMKFPRKENLMRHKRECGFPDSKMRKQPFESSCSYCNESFAKKSDLRIHLKTHAEKPKCDVCLKEFATKKSLTKHQKLHVPNEKENVPVFSLNCEHCGINFQSKSSQETVDRSLKRHVNSKHKITTSSGMVFLATGQIGKQSISGSKFLKCYYCNKTFIKKNTLRKHFKRVHKFSYEMSTNDSDVTHFKENFILRNSSEPTKLTSKNTKIHCESCSLVFPDLNELMCHIKKDHKNNSKEKCNSCPKTFSKKSNLTRHIQSVHLKNKNLCDKCDKQFSTKTDLCRHVSSAHDGKTFACKFCDRTFNVLVNMKRHTKNVHNKESTQLSLSMKKPRKSVDKLTPRQLKNHGKALSEALKTVTGEFVPLRKIVLENVVSDNEDIKESISNLFQNKKISDDDAVRIVSKVNLSDRKFVQVISELKSIWGQKSVKCNAKKALVNRKKILKHLFKKEKVLMDVKKDKKTKKWIKGERWLVYTDQPKKVSEIKQVFRGEKTKKTEICSSDHGKELMKIALTHISESNLVPKNEGTNKEKKQLVSKFDTKDVFREHGVKGVTVLAAVAAPETYDNMRLVYEKCNINELDEALHVADMKLGNILVGKQNHKATWPCIWGKCTKKNGLWSKGENNSFEHLMRCNENFEKDTEGKTEKQKLDKLKNEKYQNCIKPSIIKPKSKDGIETLVLKKMMIPPLHTILLGPGNDIYDDILKNMTDEEKETFEEFIDRDIGINRKLYFSETWEGNQIKIILKNLDKIEKNIPQRLLPTVEAFRSLEKLYSTASRRSADDKEEYIKVVESDIEIFKGKIEILNKDFGFSITNKIHTIFDHITDYISMSGRTLGETNDQVIEATHQDLNQRIQSSKYEVVNKRSPRHGRQLLRAILHYNAYNL